MVSIVIYCEFEKVGNACRNSLNYKVKKEVCGPDRALFEKGFDGEPRPECMMSGRPDRALFEKGFDD